MKKLYLPLLPAIFFSGSYIAAKYTTFDLGPLTTSFLRYAIALIFLCFLIFYYKPAILRIEKRDIHQFVLLGLFGIVGYHFFFFSSLKYTSVINTGIIHAFSPVLTGFIAALFIKEKLSLRNYVGIFLAFLGVLILITQGKLQTIFELSFNLGDILMVLAVLSWVIYSLIIKGMSKKYKSFTLIFYATLFGLIMLFFLAIFEGGITQVQNISLRSIISILYMGIFASGIGYLLYNYSIKDFGPTKTSSIVYSVSTILVTIFSFIFLKETMTFSMIISTVFVISGLHAMLSE